MDSTSGRRPPTLDEVAARAGVGRGTASRVVNGSSQVSAAARTAVQQAVDDLGYVPNRAARALVTRSTDTVALVISESEHRVFSDPFFAQIVRAVSHATALTPWQLMMTLARSDEDRKRLGDYLGSQHVDGVLLVSLHHDDPLPRTLAGRNVPAVSCGRLTPEGDLPFVDIDNHAGAVSAVEHLIARGRRRIVTVAGDQELAAGRDRLRGYRDALAAAGLPVTDDRVAYGDFGATSGAAATRELLARCPDLDAVFAASDRMALGAMSVLAQAGRSVPDDVAVVGFDGSRAGEQAVPSLTTVHQPVEDLGATMVRMLVDLIEGRRTDNVVLGTHLVVRDSS